jgi:penicillin-binding protein 1A
VLSNGDAVRIDGDGLKFAARALSDKAPANQRIRRGAVIRLSKDDKGRYAIGQMPQAEASFLALDPSDGAIFALVGGFDFERNKFNHVTQAQRQPGSAFKPFIYSAALEKGFTPATVINDAPFFVPAEKTGGEDWEPKNYDGKFEGPMRLRVALAKSKNLVTVRVLQAIGPQYAQDYIARFGFDPRLHPAYLTMGLGAGAATPVQMGGAYAVFANGGYRVSPYLIGRITDAKGNVLSQADPPRAGESAERAIDPRNAFVMTSLLRDVVAYGTATRAQSLGRKDIAGKTGTTNENVDAWFCGFTPSLVGIAWIGFDQPRTLGANETGAVAALPIWIAFMQRALKGQPEKANETPQGVVQVRINPDTGLRDDASTLSDWFYAEAVPRPRDDTFVSPNAGRSAQDVRNQLF